MTLKAAAPDINESRKNGESPFNLVNRLSKEKALEVAKSHSGLIIASDQVATLVMEIMKMMKYLQSQVVMRMLFCS